MQRPLGKPRPSDCGTFHGLTSNVLYLDIDRGCVDRVVADFKVSENAVEP